MTSPTQLPDERLAAIEAAASRISNLIHGADLATPIEHLNRWKVRDLVAHLGGVHRWATRIVAERSMAGPGYAKAKLEGDQLCDWFDEGAQLLLAELRRHDPQAPCPNFNPGSERTVGWWIRRQALESVVHRWDVEAAFGCTTEIPARLAADGVDEFVDVFLRRRGKQTLDAPLILRTTRPKREWTAAPAAKPGRVDVEAGRADLPAGATEIAGKPESLLLALWGRKSATETKLRITGDTGVAAHLIAI